MSASKIFNVYSEHIISQVKGPMDFVKEKDAKLSTKFMEQGETKIHLAVCSGILATCGSLFGKLAGGAEFVFLIPMVLKVSLLVLMVVTNTIGCTFFVKALNGSESSLPATVASTAMNYVCSVSNRCICRSRSRTVSTNIIRRRVNRAFSSRKYSKWRSSVL
ncbi:uncharacterized protein LOC118441381 isoform X4 [Vespa mandarinia]|uniref:uncharacterized protein LOC118441381 isoform X4 n=1 Tax=Vespa mandarinia TaxID=7446 RepID=UPI001620F789|nr:uncharacterized protein LOC118441381 isoform X4 [Vespa mandarinia]